MEDGLLDHCKEFLIFMASRPSIFLSKLKTPGKKEKKNGEPGIPPEARHFSYLLYATRVPDKVFGA